MKKLPKIKESILDYLQDPEYKYLYNLISPKIYQLENLKEQLDYKTIKQKPKPFTFSTDLQDIEDRIRYEIEFFNGVLAPEIVEPAKIDLWIGSDLEQEFNDLLKPLEMPSNDSKPIAVNELKPIDLKPIKPILGIKEIETLPAMKPVIPSIPLKNTFKRRFKIQGI
ncbi:hypothetical protein HK103_006543 [Boothiomyces macroporosus]|uniref:Uncharacterized protein n=1 Tax=Boothiomyces macroporosus TaxID=261099 RepID=A0AAD5Y700_9FUNG|nr:hypothetical protein HK103_006543 [Boothiomyces macroporosus]